MNLEVKIAESKTEIDQALSLRYKVFNLEMGSKTIQMKETERDTDKYDDFCEHLIVIDKNFSDRVVGTYRILSNSSSLRSGGFYSEQEFDLSKIKCMKENVAEVGRSCVAEGYRDGSVISFLWSGLANYMKENSIRYLMGCASVYSTDPKFISFIYAWLKNKNAISDASLRVNPLPSHLLPGFQNDLEDVDIPNKIEVPPLLKGYLRLGAKIGGEPALDRNFGTTDFFILFDYTSISKKYGKHYERK